ncbi:MAG TPA: ester cyclase [Thermomicrobiales bacterium]|nr:ester cyclase [Thermomicrobiales bacterium]
MSTEANKDVVRRYFRDLADNTNPGAAGEILAAGYACHVPGNPGLLDRAGLAQFVGGFHAAFPGITHTVEDLVAERDRVAARITVRGANRGEFMGLPPTGREIEIGAVNFFTVRDGRIAEQRVLFDNLALMQQLGLASAAG